MVAAVALSRMDEAGASVDATSVIVSIVFLPADLEEIEGYRDSGSSGGSEVVD